ncbi:MAG: hypothetical protein GC178_02345 [Flavobacteriales bacterium]|nr:hypothetical protein [Flavobacteriales bacterium]
MNRIVTLFGNVFFEVVIMLAFIISINNYFGNQENYILSDGIGYYDHLPSAFIHHDLVRNDAPIEVDPHKYERIKALGAPGGYVPYKEFMVNKYAVGTALLESPFFLATCVKKSMEGDVGDGYGTDYQKAIFWSTLFYLFLTLLFLSKLLQLYEVSPWAIRFIQILLVFATPITHYANAEASFSHVYSLFAITAFMYFAKDALNRFRVSSLILAGLIFGLVISIRQLNLLVILMLPFLAGSMSNLLSALTHWFQHFRYVVLSAAAALAVISVQLFVWYLQTGHWFVYSYQGESFNFVDPHFIDILFSYRKGLFVYTPVLMVSLLAMVWWFVQKKVFLATSWIFYFVTITYVLSSWWSWYYGCSYGLRAYIDYFAFFFIPIGILLTRSAWYFSLPVAVLMLACIPVNAIQTKQYKAYILNWMDMDKEKYWKVFLRTEPQFEGLTWKEAVDLSQFNITHTAKLGKTVVPEKPETAGMHYNLSEVPDFQNVDAIQVLLYNDFNRGNDLDVVFEINEVEPKVNRVWDHRYLIQFADEEFGKPQMGQYLFRFGRMNDTNEKKVVLYFHDGSMTTELDSVQLRFLSRK